MRIAGIAIAAALLAAAPAGADSVVYVQDHNLWMASPDGAQHRQLTTNGSADNDWSSPSSADSDMVLGTFGSGNNNLFQHLKPDGTVVHSNAVTMKNCGNGNSGPFQERMSHDGQYVAYGYFCNYGYDANFAVDRRIAVAFPDRYTAAANLTDWTGYQNPTWFGSRIVAVGTSGDHAYIQPAQGPGDLRAPFTTQFDAFLQADAGESLERAEFNRAGNRLLVEAERNGTPVTDILAWNGVQGPGGTIQEFCTLATDGEAHDATFSPDGQRVAWKDNSGVRVSPPISTSAPGCYSGSPTAIAPAGNSPVYGRPDVPAPQETPPPPPPEQPPAPIVTPTPIVAPPDSAAPNLIVAAGRRLRLRRVLRTGLPIQVTCSEACTITGEASLARRLARRIGVAAARRTVVARGTKTLAQAGRATVRLKFTRKARRALARRPRTLRLLVRIVAADAVGNRKVSKKTVRVRR